MALRVLDKISSDKIELSASVCIVGAGIAGLIAATRLARDKQLRIIVVESGLRNADPSVAALNEVDNAGAKYDGALLGRSRALGGTLVDVVRKTPSPGRERYAAPPVSGSGGVALG